MSLVRPLTDQELEAAFHVYIRTLEQLRTSKCYWPVFHVVLVLPDICASLEHPNGRSTPKRYEKWCDQYLPDSKLTGADWYRMRGAVLHLGSSIPDPTYKIRSQYSSMSFVDPVNAPAAVHLHVEAGNITVEIQQATDAMLAGMRQWFRDLSQPEPAAGASHVRANLRTLVREQQKQIEFGRFAITTSSV